MSFITYGMGWHIVEIAITHVHVDHFMFTYCFQFMIEVYYLDPKKSKTMDFLKLYASPPSVGVIFCLPLLTCLNFFTSFDQKWKAPKITFSPLLTPYRKNSTILPPSFACRSLLAPVIWPHPQPVENEVPLTVLTPKDARFICFISI